MRQPAYNLDFSDAWFVGREPELRLARRLAGQAHGGQGQALVLLGPAGIGKTRLAQEAAAAAELLGLRILRGRCPEQAGAPPFWPWRQMVRALLPTLPADALRRHDTASLQLLAAIVPELAQHLALATVPTPPVDDANQCFAVFDALLRLFATAAASGPLMLVIDDLHCADRGSLRLLDFVVAESATLPMMLLATARDDEADAAHSLSGCLADLARAPHYRRLVLAGLSMAETTSYLARAGVTDPQLAEAIHDRTEGHPLYLVESVRLLLPDGGPGTALDEAAIDGIPDTVRDVIARRLARLSPATVRVLTTAACIGRSFDFGLLAALEIERSEAALLEELDEAVAARIVEAQQRADHYRFGHALIRETLYLRLPPARRSSLHRRIGEWLEARVNAPAGRLLPQIAHHFAQAVGEVPVDKVLACLRSAAEQAALTLAHDEALRLLQQALVLARARRGDDAALCTALLLQLGDTALAGGNGAAAAAAYAQAALLAQGPEQAPEQAPKPVSAQAAALARAAIGFERACVISAESDPRALPLLRRALALPGILVGQRVQIEAGLCRALIYGEQLADAEQAHRRAVALARTQGDVAGLYTALASFGPAVFVPALLPTALRSALEAWQVLERAGRLQETSPESNAWLLFGLLRAGETQALQALLDQLYPLARRSRSPYHLAMLHCAALQLAMGRGDLAQAEALAEQALHAARRASPSQADSAYGLQMFCIRREQGRLGEVQSALQGWLLQHSEQGVWRPGLALLYAELGDTEACRAAYDRLPWQNFERLRADARSQTLLLFAAQACVFLEDKSRAGMLYARLAPQAGTQLVADLAGPCAGSADRLLGELAVVQQHWDVAQRHFDAALDGDASSGGRAWLAHGRFGLAHMLAKRGDSADRGRASELLRSVRQEATEMGLAALQQRAEALATRLLDEPAQNGDRLTARELEVLRLVAIGRNNRDIGAVLDISPNTVANHVRSILEKTFCANRTEAAAYARRTGVMMD